ncbi:Crp/Fnr family transcriptional regulator [Chryseobacterium sp. PTM-20240506]|uniref:Crp/Fnr family transcriptional regulator n=1 Tax=unclassified Chryseobacterium TaxID=2593645 RepID=UPI002358F404|nr:Crp/Fnr family transcriptional regulator [Chryseobacterium sp. B21-037]MDC8107174.1 Crp/Fnr family transcriptional regulator [Chryseobacterium sp. B21-037]MDC8107200.1 Crp/Fnr family transcriptional regulator [Chryseobacterium sp. B21-037]WBV56367.1 Crp/Fnr family transcriptional regulator [Chryseobacterium daecheongense]WBV56400.1 Crp/Fnr family transcriptional regulator [Chryseobacterium daecheongense]
MPNDFFLNYVGNYIETDEELKLALIQSFEYQKIEKKNYLQIPCEVCNYQYFIISGCVKTYHTDKHGKDHTIIFLPPQWWASDLNSFFNGTVSDYSIMAIVDTEVLRISKNSYDKLLSQHPIMETFFRKIYQGALIAQHKKVVEMLSLSAQERYDNFLQQFPNLSEYISFKDIATYLNMTPEHLSYLRKKM